MIVSRYVPPPEQQNFSKIVSVTRGEILHSSAASSFSVDIELGEVDPEKLVVRLTGCRITESVANRLVGFFVQPEFRVWGETPTKYLEITAPRLPSDGTARTLRATWECIEYV